jgi:hypothetical protein
MLKLMGAAPAVGILLGAAGAWAQTVTVEDIRVQLLYEHSGKLSEDIAKRQDFALWNISIGGGDVEEPANSFLVAVAVRGEPKKSSPATLTITVADAKRKQKIAEKSYKGLLFGPEGRVWRALFVNDHVCTPLTITARVNGSPAKTIDMPFQCGE